LHAQVVLIGEEVGETVVGVVTTGRIDSGGRALIEGVGPVFDSNVFLVVGMPGRGYVAGRVDAGGAGAEVLVDDHAAIHRQTGSFRQVRPRNGADPHDD